MAALRWIRYAVSATCLAVTGVECHSTVTITPNPAYAGRPVTFSCVAKPAECPNPEFIEIARDSSPADTISCSLTEFSLGGALNVSYEGKPLCNKNGTSVNLNASLSMNGTYQCKAYTSNTNISCQSNAVQLEVYEAPSPPNLSIFHPTYTDGDTADISCYSAKGIPSPQMKLTVSTNGADLVSRIKTTNVSISQRVTYEWHGATVTCTITNHKLDNMTVAKNVHVNFIRETGAKELGLFNESTALNGSSTLDCGHRIESYPPATFTWFKYEAHNHSFSALQPSGSNISVLKIDLSREYVYKCVATNTAANKSLEVTFPDKNSAVVQDPVHKEEPLSKMMIAIIASVAAVSCALIVVGLVIFCRKRRRLGSSHEPPLDRCDDRSQRYGGTPDEDDFAMQDNELYEATQMAELPVHGTEGEQLLPPTDQSECLIIASDTIVYDLEDRALGKALMVMYSDQTERSDDILSKVESTVSASSKPKNVALLLHSNYNGLLLTKADTLIINSKNASCDQRLKRFFTELVSRYMDASSADLRIDLLNCTKLSAFERTATAEALTCHLKVPVTLSFDVYGASTRIDGDRTVADLYFHRFNKEDIIYAEIDLPKDVQRGPKQAGDRVIYSELRK